MNIPLYIESSKKLLLEYIRINDYKNAFFLLINMIISIDDRFKILEDLKSLN